MTDLKIGDTITMRPVWGAGDPLRVSVTGLGEEGGKTVFDYIDPRDSTAHWAYLDQIIMRAVA